MEDKAKLKEYIDKLQADVNKPSLNANELHWDVNRLQLRKQLLSIGMKRLDEIFNNANKVASAEKPEPSTG